MRGASLVKCFSGTSQGIGSVDSRRGHIDDGQSNLALKEHIWYVSDQADLGPTTSSTDCVEIEERNGVSSLLVRMSCPYAECKNKKLIVLDTSLLVAILNFLCQQYESAHGTDPVVGSFDDLCSGLQYFLDCLRECAVDGCLHVSTRVLRNEVNALDRESTIRRRVPLPDRLMSPNRLAAYGRLNQLLEAYLLPTDIADELVAQLHAAYAGRRSISDEDMSLLAVAIVKSEGLKKVAVLSLDEELLDWGLKIRSLRKVLYEGSQLSTLHIEPEYGVTFLAMLHDCCEIETSPFQSLAQFVESRDINRIEELSASTLTQKWRRWQRLNRVLLQSAVRKEQQRAAPSSA